MAITMRVKLAEGKGRGDIFCTIIESGFQWFFTFRKPAGNVTLNRVRIKWHKRSDRRMEIKMLKKALEEREASGGGFDGFDGGDGGMRIATITAVARAFNNASRRRPQVSHTHGESCPKIQPNFPIFGSWFLLLLCIIFMKWILSFLDLRKQKLYSVISAPMQ